MEGKLSALLHQGADRHDHLQDQLRQASAEASQRDQQVSVLKKAAHACSRADSAEPQQKEQGRDSGSDSAAAGTIGVSGTAGSLERRQREALMRNNMQNMPISHSMAARILNADNKQPSTQQQAPSPQEKESPQKSSRRYPTRRVSDRSAAGWISPTKLQLGSASEFSRLWKEHDQAWATFEESIKKGGSCEANIKYCDVPFPQNALMKQSQSAEDPEQTFRTLARRWHPDKFKQRFGSKLHRPHSDRILEQVVSTFQLLSETKAKATNTKHGSN